jgi:SpoVK/Ycf46/Vps4 family AAA+-type ATPase
MPAGYVARSDVEKALQESLRQLELQAKERVDLLEALRDSRKEAGKDEKTDTKRKKLEKGKGSVESLSLPRPAEGRSTSGWLGGGTIPPAELPRAPVLPTRPPIPTDRSTDTLRETRSYSVPMPSSSGLSATPSLPVPAKQISRSPSPDAGRKTMRTTLRTEKKGFKSPRSVGNQRRRAEPMKAASMAWDVQPRAGSQASLRPESDSTIEARLGSIAARRSLDQGMSSRRNSQREEPVQMPDPSDYTPNSQWREVSDPFGPPSSLLDDQLDNLQLDPVSAPESSNMEDLLGLETPPQPPPHGSSFDPVKSKRRTKSPTRLTKPPDISYRREYPKVSSDVPPALATKILDRAYNKTAPPPPAPRTSSGVHRKPLASSAAPKEPRPKVTRARTHTSSGSESERIVRKVESARAPKPKRATADRRESATTVTPPSTDADSHEDTEQMEADERSQFQIRADKLMKNLPKGVDENAAKQVFNEIVVEGDEVHWDDVAGLDAAKKALKEAVVYPFLRPDLFMGLREPARGMLLFGPAGTGKTMLARAVATESKSTFFAISASSLTSKWHGESEKLVRALFALAKALAPSIIFVDEIDSLLSSRSSSSEHEASRRSKTEFLIQWSDLQKAAAGRDTSKEIGDPTRVLVLAATNLPWDIDEAARRRFVRRQYIPLPEGETREVQLRTLLGHQKHGLSAQEIWKVVGDTEGNCCFLACCT